MQTPKNIKTPTAAKQVERQLSLLLQDYAYHLAGQWQWPLHTNTVFCADVMFAWPEDFAGTKALIHPDDKAGLAQTLSQLQAGKSLTFSFRIITTYGEVKEVHGEEVELITEAEQPANDAFALVEKQAVANKETIHHRQQLTTYDETSRYVHSGVWHTNLSTGHTWASDEIYRILGLPAQSLNAHPNTLYPFILPDDRQAVINAFEEAFARLAPLHLRFRIVQAGGTERWVEHTSTFGFNEQGQMMMNAVLQDVTELQGREEQCGNYELATALQRQHLSLAEAAASIGYWQVNTVTKKTTYSDNVYRLFGLKPGPAGTTAATFTNLVHTDDREAYEAAAAKIRKEYTATDLDFRIIRPDGKLRYLRQRGRVVTSGGETVVMGTLQDLTVQRMLERKLADYSRTAEIKLALALQTEDTGVQGSWIWNFTTGANTWSDNLYNILGQKQANELSQEKLFKLIHPNDKAIFEEALATTTGEKKETRFTIRFIRRGEVRYLKTALKVLSIGGDELLFGTVQDVTAEHQQIEELAGRVQLMESLADSIPAQVIATDADNTILLWNRICEDVYNRKREKTVGQNLFDIIPGLKNTPLLQRLNEVMAGEEIRNLNEAGHYATRGHFNVSHIPLRNATGAVTGILHLIRDVTTEYNLHQQLTSRLGFIERLLEVSVDRIAALDPNMNYLYWNKAAEAEYGLTSGEVVGKNILEVFPDEQRLSYADFRRALRGETVHLPPTEDSPAESYLIPVKDGNDGISSVLWVQHDRSQEMVIRRQEQKGLEILEALNENYLEMDHHYRVLFVNRRGLDFLRLSEEAIIGKVLWDVFPVVVDTPIHLAIVHAMEDRVSVRGEFKSPGEEVQLFVSIAPTVDGLAMSFSDISFIKEAERKLAQEHLRLKEAQSIGLIGSFEWHMGDEYVEWSDEMFRIMHLEPQSQRITIERTNGWVHPDDRRWVMERKGESFETAGLYKLTHRVVLDDGTVKWVNHRFESFADSTGAIVQVRGTLQDVTEQKATEQKLSEEHRRLNEAQVAGRIGSYEWEADSNFTTWSDEMYRLHGLAPQSEPISMDRVFAFTHPADLDRFKKVVQKCRQVPCNLHLTHRIVRTDGEVRIISRTVESAAGEDGRINRLWGTAQDVTEQKRLEMALQRFKQQWGQLLENTPDIITRWSPDLRLLSYNSAFLKTTGITTKKPVGKTHKELGFDTEAAQRFIDDLTEVLRSKEPVVRRMAYPTPEGEKHFQTRLFPELDESGEVTAIGTITTDITELRESERRLLRLQEELAQQVTDKYHKVMASMDQGFCIIECLFDKEDNCTNWRYLDGNAVFKKQIGFEDAVGKTINELVPGIEPFWKKVYGTVALTGQPVRKEHHLAAFNRWYEVDAFRIDSPEERHVAVLFNDITERKRREADLAFLADISQDLVRMTKPNETLEILGAKICAHFNTIRSLFVEIIENEQKAIVREWHRPGLKSTAGEVMLSQFITEKFHQQCRAGESAIVENVHQSDLVDGKRMEEVFGVTAFILVPMLSNGQWRFTLGVHNDRPRKWRDDELELLQELTARIWTRLEKVEAEIAMQQSEEKYRTLFDSIDEGFCIIELIYNEDGKANDFCYLEVNESYERLTGLKDAKGKYAHEIAPNTEGEWFNRLDKVVQTGDPIRFEEYNAFTGRWYSSFAFPASEVQKHKVAILFDDITDRKRREANLAFLAEVSNDLVGLNDVGETINLLAPKIGRYFGVKHCLFAEHANEQNMAVVSLGWNAANVPSLKGAYPINDFLSKEIMASFLKGEPLVVHSTQADPRVSADSYGKLGIESFIIVPLVRAGDWRFQISIIDNKQRQWREDEVALLGELTSRIWTRLEKVRAEDALRRSEEKYRSLFNSIDEGFSLLELIFDAKGKVVDYWYRETNPMFQRLTGVEDAVGRRMSEVVPDLEPEWYTVLEDVYYSGEPVRIEYPVKGVARVFTAYFSRIGGKSSPLVAAVYNDITERKEAEEQQVFLLRLSDTLRAEPAVDAIANRALQLLSEQLGLDRCYVGVYRLAHDRGEFPYQVGNDRVPPLPAGVRLSDFPDALRVAFDRTLVIDDVAKAEGLTDTDRQNLGALHLCALVAATLRKGEYNPLWSIVAVSAIPRHWTPGEIALIEEVTERTWAAMERARAEEEVRQSEEKYHTLFDTMEVGFCVCRVIRDDEGKVINYRFLQVNPAMEKITGWTGATGKNILELLPELEPQWLETYQKVVDTKETVRVEDFLPGLNQWYDITALYYGEEQFAVYFDDISERRKAEDALAADLTGMNRIYQLHVSLATEIDLKSGLEEIVSVAADLLSTDRGCIQLVSEDGKRLEMFACKGYTESNLFIQHFLHECSGPACDAARSQRSRLVIEDVATFEPLLGTKDCEVALAEDIRATQSTPIITRDGELVGVLSNQFRQPHRPTEHQLKLIDLLAWTAADFVKGHRSAEALRQFNHRLETEVAQRTADLRERTLFTEAVIDASIDQITIFDRDERFIVWNKKAEEAGGLRREEVIGKTIAEIFPNLELEPEFVEAQRKALSGEVVYIPAKRGIYSKNYNQWFYVPLKNEEGEVYAVMNIIHDITDKVQAEEKLKQKNQQLQERNDEIAHFNFIASHDLKEPLRKLGTFSDWLAEREAANLSATGKLMLEKLANAVQRMNHLVEDISTLTKLQKMPGELETIDLNAVLKKALSSLQAKLADSGAVVDVQSLPVLSGYREQLDYLFSNLIGNAIKFQKPDIIPAVEVGCKRVTNPKGLPYGEWYCLSFTDNGIGFDPQYSDKIFRVFQRLHGQAEYPGTGMGLAICRKVMDNHGGFIAATSKPGKGSRFDCWFPAE